MSVRKIISVAILAPVIAFPLFVSQANAQASGTSGGASPGAGLGEGSVSTNGASSDWAAVQRAAQANDPGATGVAGVWPLSVPAQSVPELNPSTGVGPALTPMERAEVNSSRARYAVAAMPAGNSVLSANTAYGAGTTMDLRSFGSVTDCLNAAAREHAPLDRCGH